MMVEDCRGTRDSIHQQAKLKPGRYMIETIENLEPDRRYSFAVAATNQAGIGDYTSLTFATKSKGEVTTFYKYADVQ